MAASLTLSSPLAAQFELAGPSATSSLPERSAMSGAAAETTGSSPGFVLLRNGNVLPGQIERERAFVNIRRDASAVVRLPATEVLHWAPTLEALYAYRVQHRKPHSLTAWFADAGWCVEQGLLEIGGQELAKLARLAPNDHRVTALEARLNSAIDRNAIAASQSPETVARDLPPEEASVAVRSPDADDDRAAELHPTLVAHFTSRVQPLLINRCGQSGCHGGASDAAWQLDHFGLSSRLPATITRRNLSQLLQWVNEAEPATSPLLVRARSPHAGLTEAPLAAGDAELLSQLRAWTEAVARRSGSSSAVAGSSSQEPLMAHSDAGADSAASGPAGDHPDKPTRLPPVEDPFDPADFNRIYHRR